MDEADYGRGDVEGDAQGFGIRLDCQMTTAVPVLLETPVAVTRSVTVRLTMTGGEVATARYGWES
jgi:hypothetical protein